MITTVQVSWGSYTTGLDSQKLQRTGVWWDLRKVRDDGCKVPSSQQELGAPELLQYILSQVWRLDV